MTSPTSESEPDDLKIALIEDFKALYVKEFTADWQVQRLIRATEIEVMELPNVSALITQREVEARIDELKKLGSYQAISWGDSGEGIFKEYIPDRIAELTSKESKDE